MSALDQSITLEDVFSVVEAKRVPLAPELAGYLALEIADGADAGGGDVDPRTVFISEEGTVALVRPKKDPSSGDAEASVRRLLVKLLEASGSGTPSLTAAARRKPGNGLPALVEELEAALIPVNRAAGRRAMARLAREVKRVLLGVGRNASMAPSPKGTEPAKAKPMASAAPHARPLVRKKSLDAMPATAAPAPAPTKEPTPPPAPTREPTPAPPVDAVSAALESIQGETAMLAPRDPAIHDALTVDPGAVAPQKPAPAPSERGGYKPAARRAPASVPPPPKDPPLRGSDLLSGDEVDSLLQTFGVSNLVDDNKQVSRDLKAIAGLDPTPPPPDARTIAELTKDIGKARPVAFSEPGENASWNPPPIDGDSVEALLALADASVPPPRVDAAAPVALAPPPPASTPSLSDSQLARKQPPQSAPSLSDSQLARKQPPQSTPSLSDSQLARKQPPQSTPSLSDSQLARKDQNLPPSPLFGGSAGAAGLAAGAPAALRQSEAELPPSETARGKDAKASGSRPRVPEPSERRAKPKKARPEGKRAPKTGLALLVVTLVVLGGATAAIWKFAPQVFTGHKRPAPTVAPPASAVPAPVPACRVALVLTDAPANAEILLRMGQAPVDVERMPMGTRLEFVGTAEGQSPKRTVIRPDAVWDKTADGKLRIDVPIQLDPSKAKPGAVDPWPPAEAGSQVGGSGAPGTVHVVSNVRGAEVWLLAGLGPEARIDQLRCDADIDVLLAGGPNDAKAATPLRKRLHVSADKDITPVAADAKGNKVVTLSAK